ncbi:MAG: hypothetical protein HQK54_09935, partial [Oligoflexales bacterium]|nr:hypothetical protein [Oligoflexales bacterium]
VETVDAENCQTGFQAGFGVAYRHKSRYSLGISTVVDYETSSLVAKKDDMTMLDASWKGIFFEPRIGTRLELMQKKQLSIGMSYRPELVKKYKGTMKVNGSESSQAPVGYLPAQAGFGLRYFINPIAIFAEHIIEYHSKGRKIVKAGYTGDQELDLRDVKTYVVGGELRLNKSNYLIGGFSSQSANLGDGVMGRDPDGYPVVIVSGGGKFGDFEAMPKKTYAGGYIHRTKDVDANLMVNYTTGSRIVPDGHPGEGLYTLSVVLLGAGLVYRF